MKNLLLIGCILLTMSGCYNDKYDKLYPATAVTCDTSGTTYQATIKPIIESKCYTPGNGCHDAAGSVTSGYDFESSILVLQSTAASGQLMDDIDWTSGNNMPKNAPKLSQCEIDKIARWVSRGAQDN